MHLAAGVLSVISLACPTVAYRRICPRVVACYRACCLGASPPWICCGVVGVVSSPMTGTSNTVRGSRSIWKLRDWGVAQDMLGYVCMYVCKIGDTHAHTHTHVRALSLMIAPKIAGMSLLLLLLLLLLASVVAVAAFFGPRASPSTFLAPHGPCPLSWRLNC